MSENDFNPEQTRRWRLILGADDGCGAIKLSGRDLEMDKALSGLYDNQSEDGRERSSGLGSSAPRVARWLGDIRTYFPASVVQVMQADAIERLGLTQLLAEPEMLDSVQPNIHLVATLASLGKALPQKSRESARQVVAKVVAEVEKRLADRLTQAVRGALAKSLRTRRPRHNDIDWLRTISANLKNYQPELGTVIPEHLVGYGRRSTGIQREIVLCVDQSGSMATSVVYASIFSCVLASISSVRTSLVVFDTEVVDLTEKLDDPVDVIFGTQLGGGTDIGRALAYCRPLITHPTDTIMILISDLFDGRNDSVVAHMKALLTAGVTVIVLLALSDDGRPSYNAKTASQLAELGIPAFTCTPDQFPDLIAMAINHEDLGVWGAQAERK